VEEADRIHVLGMLSKPKLPLTQQYIFLSINSALLYRHERVKKNFVLRVQLRITCISILVKDSKTCVILQS